VPAAAISEHSNVVGVDEAAEALAATAAAAEDALQQENLHDAESNSQHEEFDCSGALRQQRQQQPSLDGVHSLLDAFPHCEMIYVDVSTHEEQQLAATVINTLAASSSRSSSSNGGCWPEPGKRPSALSSLRHHSSGSISTEQDSNTAEAAAAAAAAAQQAQQQQQQQCAATALPVSKSSPLLSDATGQQRRRPRLCLDALQRSYHCPANKVGGLRGR
jgi:hypothetical protein